MSTYLWFKPDRIGKFEDKAKGKREKHVCKKTSCMGVSKTKETAMCALCMYIVNGWAFLWI